MMPLAIRIQIIYLVSLQRLRHCTNFFDSCGNKYDLKSRIQVSDSDIETLCEQCNNLISGVYKTSCKTGEGVEEMFSDIAKQLVGSNR